MKKNLILGFLAFGTCGFAQTNVIAELTPGASPTGIAQAFGITYKEKAPGGPFYLFVVPSGMNVDAVEDAMAARADVVWAEDDDHVGSPEEVGGGKGSSVAVINDRVRAYALNARALLQVGFSRSFVSTTGRVVKIAILDTGVDPSCSILWNKAESKYNAVEGGLPYDIKRLTDTNHNGIPDEGVGHGTFVAGVIDQMSPQSKLVIVRVADSDGYSSAWRLIKGISYSVSKQAEVANISLGTLANIPALSNVIEWADAYGLTIIAAAGNNNMQTICQPAGIAKVLAVTGVDDVDHKAPFSNFDNKIEQSAPATGIKSYGPGNRMMVWSGTSFATPFVSGALIECLRHMSFRASARKVRQAVERSGSDVNAVNPNYSGKLGKRLWIPDMWAQVRVISSLP